MLPGNSDCSSITRHNLAHYNSRWYTLGTMTDDTLLEYRINRHTDKFVAIDSTDEVLGVFETEQEAVRDVERAKLEDAMYQHAKILFHAAIASVMNEFGVDLETARYWVATASEQA
jgi:hypothetical protein